MIEFATDMQDASAVIARLEEGRARCLDAEGRAGATDHLPDRGRLVATGDLHDQPFHLDRVLRVARLDASPEHHVTLHELVHGEHLVNGMDFSYRMLVRVAELKCRYPGQVHCLLANHEISQMRGAAVGKGSGHDQVEAFTGALAWVFDDRAEEVSEAIGRFIASWPLAVRTARGVLCAHSVPSSAAWSSFDPGVLDRPLEPADFEPRTGSAYLMTWGRKHDAAHLDRVAEALGVEAFILGHEKAETGWQPVGGRGLVLNTDHDRAAVLPLDLAAEPDRDAWLWSILPLSAVGESGADDPAG